jgi:hypothetical protein
MLNVSVHIRLIQGWTDDWIGVFMQQLAVWGSWHILDDSILHTCLIQSCVTFHVFGTRNLLKRVSF